MMSVNIICVLQVHLQVNDLFQDLGDGKLLMKLLEIISGEQLGRPNRGVLRVQKMENVNRCLQFLATKVCLPVGRLVEARHLPYARQRRCFNDLFALERCQVVLNNAII